VGTVSARNGLYKVMDSTDNKQKLQYIQTARRNMMQRSPGAHYWRTGQGFSQQEKYAEAIQQYNNAIAADPKLPEAYSARGYSYLKQSKYKEAIVDFDKALEIDERNGLAKAGKSIALVENGELEEGVKQVEADKEKFKTDSLFAYNSCCVYGTAMKQMKNKDESAVNSDIYLGYQQKALDELERSLSMGFNEAELIHADPDLDLLRDLPEYKAMTSKLPRLKPKTETKKDEPAKKL
jgi:tetratricopeptide (TPR) repeat protein